jgi:hypothetical protein
VDIKEYNSIVEALYELEVELDKKNDKPEQIEPDFRFEYAFESLTENSSLYKRRVSHA